MRRHALFSFHSGGLLFFLQLAQFGRSVQNLSSQFNNNLRQIRADVFSCLFVFGDVRAE